jgi:hypothetical protein
MSEVLSASGRDSAKNHSHGRQRGRRRNGLPQGTRIIHLDLNAVGSFMLRLGGLLSQPPVFLGHHEFRSEALKQLTLLEGKLVNFH